ncbi:hypothetical protein Tco_1306938, partial [Tanacetum coccineum]
MPPSQPPSPSRPPVAPPSSTATTIATATVAVAATSAAFGHHSRTISTTPSTPPSSSRHQRDLHHLATIISTDAILTAIAAQPLSPPCTTLHPATSRYQGCVCLIDSALRVRLFVLSSTKGAF